ncbi:MAG: hypothetical protein HQL40_07205 [Alphaproteobacteria bacterium]|nr:hypothetical protein [Alphaproteobacteria bacterium]
MLQLPALSAWTHPSADSYRSKVDFTGVFIAADVSWGAQIKALGLGRKMPDEVSGVLGLAAFTSHVLVALLEAMRECSSEALAQIGTLRRHHAPISRENEVALVELISTNWKLSPAVKSFYGLKLALRNRLSEIAQLPRKFVGLSSLEIITIIREADFLHLGFIESCVFAIEAFNETAQQPHRKWALLFDELEIAPDDIRQALFAALRSTDQRLIFKLSISPYHQDIQVLRSSTSAMLGEDYQTIQLWYPRKEEGYSFSEALLNAMLSDLNSKPANPEDIFSKSYFDADTQEIGYRPGSRTQKRFKSLANRDESFSRYLTKNVVDVDKMHLMSETSRAGLVRKVTSLVAVREAYRGNETASGAKERSRKNPELYTGAHALFAIVEGNPRWFIGLVGSLLREYAETGRPIPRSTQAKAITTAASRFRALLRTIPFKPGSDPQKRSLGARGLLSLLDAIGDRFHENVVIEDFSAEPTLSFIVDANTTPEVLEALGRALNAGAIILIPDVNGEMLITSLRGKRFRLSYMLAPGYGIPITLGRAASLSQILRTVGENGEGSLFSWREA